MANVIKKVLSATKSAHTQESNNGRANAIDWHICTLHKPKLSLSFSCPAACHFLYSIFLQLIWKRKSRYLLRALLHLEVRSHLPLFMQSLVFFVKPAAFTIFFFFFHFHFAWTEHSHTLFSTFCGFVSCYDCLASHMHKIWNRSHVPVYEAFEITLKFVLFYSSRQHSFELNQMASSELALATTITQIWCGFFVFLSLEKNKMEYSVCNDRTASICMCLCLNVL